MLVPEGFTEILPLILTGEELQNLYRHQGFQLNSISVFTVNLSNFNKLSFKLTPIHNQTFLNSKMKTHSRC